MLICSECGTIFNDDFLGYDGLCPLRNCTRADLIEIDENLYETYLMLNEKGYCTRNCCSAHSFDDCPQTYIQFQEFYPFLSLPIDFKVEERSLDSDPPYTTISKAFDRQMPSVGLQKQIWQTAKDVLEWAESLEYSEDIE